MADPADITKVNREPVWVAHNDVILGYANEGDVTVTITSDWVPQTFAQTGTYIVDDFFNGAQCTIQTSIAQVLDYDKWVIAFPYGRKQDDSQTPTPENRFVFVDGTETDTGLHVGQKASTFAAQLRIMPASSGSAPTTETARDFWAHRAYVKEVGPILFGNTGPQSLDVTFHVLYDPDVTATTESEHFVVFGKETEVWTDS